MVDSAAAILPLLRDGLLRYRPDIERYGLLLLPASLLTVPDTGAAIYGLLCVSGLLHPTGNRPGREEYRRILLIGTLPATYFFVAAVSVAVSGHYHDWFKPLMKLSELLTTPLIALWLVQTRAMSRTSPDFFRLNAVLMCIAAAYQYFVQGFPRPGGAVNPLIFGHMSLLFGFCSVAMLPVQNGRDRLVSLLCFAAGFTGCVLSQSRAAWVSSIFLLLTLLLLWYRTGYLTRAPALALTGLYVVLTVASLNLPSVRDRILQAAEDYRLLQQQEEWNSSVGQRLVMWKSGLKAAWKHPVFGWGVHRTQIAASSEMPDSALKRQVLEHHHLHNEYVNVLVGRGISGLLSLALLLFAPLAVFFRKARKRDLLPYSVGALLCLSYAASGLSFQAFGDDTMNIIFALLLSFALVGTPAGDPDAACADGSQPGCPE